jgi:hypothetical protein
MDPRFHAIKRQLLLNLSRVPVAGWLKGAQRAAAFRVMRSKA